MIILPPIDGMILQLDTLRFSPRLDPLARRLRLTCTGSAEQIAVDLDLAD